jgi:hypothetical protein
MRLRVLQELLYPGTAPLEEGNGSCVSLWTARACSLSFLSGVKPLDPGTCERLVPGTAAVSRACVGLHVGTAPT